MQIQVGLQSLYSTFKHLLAEFRALTVWSLNKSTRNLGIAFLFSPHTFAHTIVNKFSSQAITHHQCISWTNSITNNKRTGNLQFNKATSTSLTMSNKSNATTSIQ
ncbi:hypothetical protein MGS_05916 [Candida albicans P78042]|nr:hypothetical protein MG7_05891 [Candida albicans P34048]KHC65192.1 hypothetical protein MGS_05916 [Candida albicans P78042]RLP67024.1 hypothetical protein L150_05812 [Candida albicans Ca529L]